MAPDVLELSELRVTAEPTWLPLVHGWDDVLGPHSVKVTVPVGAPVLELPITVAVSVTLPLGPILKSPHPSCWPTVGW